MNGCTQSDGLVRPRQNHKLVSVQDNGPGVPEATKQQIFEHWKRTGNRPSPPRWPTRRT
ncbi:MAG: ATP-binding protein [Zoogloea sp.]|jgi:K+-sensing histidine kinase KdpD|nr:ATP-binding protein [Zoogloea sp.]